MESVSTKDKDKMTSRKRKRDDTTTSSKIPKTDEIGSESCLDQPGDQSVHEVVNDEPSTLPAIHYDPDTTEPISCSLKSLDELLSWTRKEASPFNMATVPLASRFPSLDSCPRRTLVSHDMMGGYLEDRFIQGTEVDMPYAFYHWEYIDIFNYFSHQMTTIPPAVWTNAAHKHGVLSIGTFITEWTDGAKICEAFLADEESYRTAADKLVQISHCYGFDGWLINIENELSETAVKNTGHFLRYLTDQMHERVPGSVVIWYDSVLKNGTLNWQNELNDDNRMFFDACDGIFTNYNWTEQSLERMKSYSAAQGRFADIYVGVDVFARGKVIGGKFETNKALELIRKYDLSTAIFAPGWVYEIHEKADFQQNQDKFWSLLSEFLYIHRLSSSLPFISSFCQGFGKSLYWRGEVEMERSWFNLHAQEIQPLYLSENMENGGWLRSRGCSKDAWIGGNSLMVEGMIPSGLPEVCARIFSLHVPLVARTFVSFVYKPPVGVKVSLELKTIDVPLCTFNGMEEIASSSVFPEALAEDNQLVEQFVQNCGRWTSDGWITKCFLLKTNGCSLREVCIRVSRDEGDEDVSFNCRIGEIMFMDAETLHAPLQSVQGICVNDVVWRTGASKGPGHTPMVLLNTTLHWQYPTQQVRHFRIHWRRLRGPDPRIPPGPLTLIGRSYSTLYRVVELEVPAAPGLIELVVEPVSREGFRVPEDRWGRRTLSYSSSGNP
ncbi:cytosolic endo-beta-N-acetylglucosaminidase [Pimephales promelas]|uniref:cytosolic endo-beta-N-acetylglucosaminidase n=1 Tax=Pimephales promelas TaxID=90988 RepID=UPI001955866E|nr:cytosolic endo-beta-N-acetylglucosaminidase [Pimephales promelas]KAG1968327.1 cytosolic endo-beta-N-acetylglucosaminidase [Pimephales promelas]